MLENKVPISEDVAQQNGGLPRRADGTVLMGPQGWSNKWNRPSGASELLNPRVQTAPGGELQAGVPVDIRAAVTSAANAVVDAKKVRTNGNGEVDGHYVDQVARLTDLLANQPGAIEALRELQNGR